MSKLRADITYGNKVPYDKLDKWQREAQPWTVVLRYKRRRMTFSFWTGITCSLPVCFDAAYCVISDAQGVNNSRSFEDWCGDYGYDSDSRTAERTYKQCTKQSDKLQALLGEDYERILGLDEEELKKICV